MTTGRKADHLRINLEEDVQFPRLRTGFESVHLVHQALPELDLDQVDTSTSLFGRELAAPILISSMTGGTEDAGRINRNLALAAEETGIALGLGSLRAAIEDSSLAPTFKVREVAPNILLFANLGAIQLNYGYGVRECQLAVDMCQADALILHLNPLQEAVQPEGDRNWSGLLNRIEDVCRELSVPVIAKEVGWGLSHRAITDLVSAGVAALDVAGSGGTSWSEVEYHRAPTEFHSRVAAAFVDWGIPTLHSLIAAQRAAPQIPVFASGGLRTGIDVAKAIALGASLAGLASPFLQPASISAQAAIEKSHELAAVLQIAMFAAGAGTLSDLRNAELILPGQS